MAVVKNERPSCSKKSSIAVERTALRGLAAISPRHGEISGDLARSGDLIGDLIADRSFVDGADRSHAADLGRSVRSAIVEIVAAIAIDRSPMRLSTLMDILEREIGASP